MRATAIALLLALGTTAVMEAKPGPKRPRRGFDLFAESDEADNESALPVSITGRQVREAPVAAC